MEESKMEVKDIIRLRRQQLGLSLRELGEKCNADKTTVRKWELGEIENMKRDKMVLLSKALDVSPLVLLGIEDYQIPSEPIMQDKVSVYGKDLNESIGEIDNPYPSITSPLFALEVEVDECHLLTPPTMFAILKKQSEGANDTVMAVKMKDEPIMLRKFYQVADVVVLKSITEDSEPITLVGEQLKDLCILGKLVGLVSRVLES